MSDLLRQNHYQDEGQQFCPLKWFQLLNTIPELSISTAAVKIKSSFYYITHNSIIEHLHICWENQNRSLSKRNKKNFSTENPKMPSISCFHWALNSYSKTQT